MNCEACRGACCESFSIPAAHVRTPGPDEQRWLELHGAKAGGEVSFECRCTALTPEGRCAVYSSRPMVCIVYERGGPDCLETVRRRRTPEQYQAIRGPEDPEAIHDLPCGECGRAKTLDYSLHIALRVRLCGSCAGRVD